jgi:hypothetical protein
MYALVKDGVVVRYPYTVTDLRLENPSVSFANTLGEETLAQYGVVPVVMGVTPSVLFTQVAVEVAPTFDADSQRWVQAWDVVDRSLGELSAYEASVADSVRQERNERLQATDWYGMSDVTMPPAVAEYRQALRDIPSQEGFPYVVMWPTKP